jgi:hypothetical protein
LTANIELIAEQGLRKEVAGRRFACIYGRGIYFTDSSCLAHQLTDRGHYMPTHARSPRRGIILLCRVVLGNVEQLKTETGGVYRASAGFDSLMAKHDATSRRPFKYGNGTASVQVHNEFVVFDNAAVYPEFVLEFGRKEGIELE